MSKKTLENAHDENCELQSLRSQLNYYKGLTNRLSSENWMTSRINCKNEGQLYQKKGKKYVKANDVWALEGLRNGDYFIRVRDGSTSIRQAVYPHKAPLIMAARDLEDKLIDIIRSASQARPKSIPLTVQAKADWDRLIKNSGESFSTLEYPSIQENAEAIVKVLLDKALEKEGVIQKK